jgi:hypothetical protein
VQRQAMVKNVEDANHKLHIGAEYLTGRQPSSS